MFSTERKVLGVMTFRVNCWKDETRVFKGVADWVAKGGNRPPG